MDFQRVSVCLSRVIILDPDGLVGKKDWLVHIVVRLVSVLAWIAEIDRDVDLLESGDVDLLSTAAGWRSAKGKEILVFVHSCGVLYATVFRYLLTRHRSTTL